VFNLDEAEALRDAGVQTPILVLGASSREDADRAARLSVACTVTRAESVEALAQAARASDTLISVHVKVDTGMYRLAPIPAEALRLVDAVRQRSGLRLEGFYSHFPSADAEDGTDTQRRVSRFLRLAEQVHAPIRHVANTATLLRFPQMSLDLVRVGAGLYGFGCGAAEASAAAAPQPVLRWQARLVQIQEVPAGASVSYGGTWTAETNARVGVVAVGYADGFRRGLSNRGVMLVHGQRVAVVGTVCMDLTLIDLSQVPRANVGDVVTLIGRDGDAEITIEDVATACDTIAYEVLTGLGSWPERRYLSPSAPASADG
jgi:alanine racemase